MVTATLSFPHLHLKEQQGPPVVWEHNEETFPNCLRSKSGLLHTYLTKLGYCEPVLAAGLFF